MRYRKKPVVIEAFKWTGDADQTEDPVWICQAIKEGKVRFVWHPDYFDCVMLIDALEGTHVAHMGDYIIQGIAGEIYPCKPHIFEMTYEKAE